MTDDDTRIGEEVSITGIAGNGAAGAFVYADHEPYYLAAVESWDADIEGRRVTVTGVLRRRPAQVTPDEPPDEHSHGLAADTYVIDDSTWSPAEPS